ncbi:MAG: 2-amino-4-hydroxy-6-hydroxymethyldihydropteridine diphosphokinase [Alphaproteobacteria bacterium]
MTGRSRSGRSRGVEVFIALGSNLGNRVDNLSLAMKTLEGFVTLSAWSPTYDTAPEYVTDQPRFLNMVVRGETALSCPDLLMRLKRIEADLGRVPGQRFGPRPIDLDILFYGDAVIDLPDLIVPHPRLAERVFVLRPLSDIAPGKRHPVTGQTVVEMFVALTGGDVRPIRIEG